MKSFFKGAAKVLAAIVPYLPCNRLNPAVRILEEKAGRCQSVAIDMGHDAASKVPVEQNLQIGWMDSGSLGDILRPQFLLEVSLDERFGTVDVAHGF